MPTAVIVDAVRTPLGRRNGALKDVHPVDLAALTLDALVQRNDLDPELVEDVIMGCVMQVGDQAVNVGRNAALAAGFPESVVGTTVDRQCGSSQQAAHFAAQGVIAGAYDIVIAAGVESMTRVPMGASFTPGSQPFGPKVFARYQERGGLVPQGISAELIAEKWNISREDNDRFSLESHLRAARATEEGRFEREIVPVEVTAGNSSQISDGAAAVLVTSEEAATRLGLTPKARFHTFALAGVDPVFMLTGPIPATAKVLERAKMTVDQMDLVEINEAFAPVVLSWEKE